MESGGTIDIKLLNPYNSTKKTIFVTLCQSNMIEFLFGLILGVWMGQQLPLPSVQMYIQNWWNNPAINNAAQNAGQTNVDEEEKPVEVSVPVFTGEMPSSV